MKATSDGHVTEGEGPNVLRRFLTAKNMTAREVSMKAGLDPGYLSKVVNGKPRYKNPRSITLQRVAHAMQLSTAEIAELAEAFGVTMNESSLTGASLIEPTRSRRRYPVTDVVNRTRCTYTNAVILMSVLPSQAPELCDLLVELATSEGIEISCSPVYGERNVVVRISTPPTTGVDAFLDRGLAMHPGGGWKRFPELVESTETLYLRDDMTHVDPAMPEAHMHRGQYAMLFFRTRVGYSRHRLIKHIKFCETELQTRHSRLRLMSAYLVMGRYDAVAEVLIPAGIAGESELRQFLDAVRNFEGGRERIDTITMFGTSSGWRHTNSKAESSRLEQSRSFARDLRDDGDALELDPKRPHRPLPTKVWRASYGTSMFRDRFLRYIAGGKYPPAQVFHPGCMDENFPSPTEDIALYLNHDYYLGDGKDNYWGPGGYLYLKVGDEFDHGLSSIDGRGPASIARAYSISIGQFLDIFYQNNVNSFPLDTRPNDEAIAGAKRKLPSNEAASTDWIRRTLDEGEYTPELAYGKGWSYGRLVYLGEHNGDPVLTWTAPREKMPATTRFDQMNPDFLRMIELGFFEKLQLTSEETRGYLAGYEVVLDTVPS